MGPGGNGKLGEAPLNKAWSGETRIAPMSTIGLQAIFLGALYDLWVDRASDRSIRVIRGQKVVWLVVW